MVKKLTPCAQLLVLALVFFANPLAKANEPEDLLKNITEYQRFKAYPRIEKAYKYVEQKRYEEAFEQIQKVREYLPEHRALSLYAVNLLILDGQFLKARALAEKFSGDAEFEALLANAQSNYIRAESTTVQEFQSVTQSLSGKQVTELTVSYLLSHQKDISLLDTISLYDSLSIQQIDSSTAEVFNELLIQHQAYSFLSEHQQMLCQQRACSIEEWKTLTNATLRLKNYDQLAGILAAAPQSIQSDLVDSAIEVMVGSDALDRLINLLMPLAVNDKLNQAQLNRLYTVARGQGHTEYATELLQRMSLDCMKKADQLYQLKIFKKLTETLANCPLTPGNARDQLSLLAESKQYELLAQKNFADASLRRQQRSVLFDFYIGEGRWQSIIGLAKQATNDVPLTTAEQRMLSSAYAKTDQLPKAIEIALALWNERKELIDLDQASYYLSQNDEKKRALLLLSGVVSGNTAVIDFSPSLKQRLQVLIAAKASELTTSQLNPLVASTQTQAAVVDALLIANQCQRSLALAETVSSVSAERIILACEQDLDKRLAFLLDGIGQRSDAQKAEAAFALIARGDGEAANRIISEIHDWQNQWLFVNAKLTIAEQHQDLGAQEELLRIAARFPEQKGFVTIKRAYLAYNRKDYLLAAELFSQGFSADQSQRTAQNLEQAVFAKQFLNESKEATELLRQSIDVRSSRGETAENEKMALAQSLYRQISSPWSFTVAGWIGESARVTQSTETAFQSEYFVSSELTYDLTYDSSVSSDLAIGLGTLSGGDDFFFNTNEADFFLSYKPWKEHLFTARIGIRNNLESHNSRSYIRASYDPLQSAERQKDWDNETHWLSHSLFLDAIYYFDSATYSTYSRYKPSYDFAGENQLFYSASVYPFIQYQRTNDVVDKRTLEDTRIGAGLTHRSTWFDAQYEDYKLFMEMSLEWQYVIDSDFSRKDDNALLLRFAVYY